MANNKLAYKLAKKHRIDTDGMTPKQVWDALNEKGIDVSKEAQSEKSEEMGLHSDWEDADELEDFFDDKKESGQNTNYEGIAKDDTSDKQFKSPTPKEFKANLATAKASVPEKNRWRVDGTYSEEDYSSAKLFSTAGGSTVAVKDGDIISVCKNENDKQVRGSDLVQKAIENGGDRLDAFGEDLYDFYTKNGFEAVSWTPFNEEYAPEDWSEKIAEEEPVIFYKYIGNKSSRTYEDFLKEVKSSKDYDESKEKRDKEIKK